MKYTFTPFNISRASEKSFDKKLDQLPEIDFKNTFSNYYCSYRLLAEIYIRYPLEKVEDIEKNSCNIDNSILLGMFPDKLFNFEIRLDLGGSGDT